MPPRRSPALFVFGTVAIDAMGIGIIIPVMPDLLQELSDADIGEAARWGGYLAFSYALMQFLFSPLIGALSDRFGRRPVLMVSLATLGVDYLVMAMAPTLWILFIGRVIAGIAGATHTTATAYIADVTPRERRAAAFGMVGAGFGVGFVLGPVIGGIMGEFGTRAPFHAAAALAFLNLAYGFFFLPESLACENRRRFNLGRANPLGALRQLAHLPMIAWFLGVIFLYALSHTVYPAVWSYYTKEAFDWSPSQIGWSLALVGIGFAVVQMGLIRLFLKRFGEVRTAYLGFLFNVIGLTAIAVVTEGWMLFALMPLIALGDIVKPALTGLMSNRVADDAQGELQGVISSAQSITTVISPLLMTQVFAVFSTPPGIYLPGAPFLLAALVMVIAALIFRRGLAADRARARNSGLALVRAPPYGHSQRQKTQKRDGGSMASHFDELETRASAAREASQFECLRELLTEALPKAPGLARHLDGVDPATLTDRAALARLPVLRKSALAELQKADPPFGGLTTRPPSGFTHMFQSPGPIYEPGMDTPDWWRFARALWAGGLRPGDVVLNCFAYHLTPAGLMFDSGARAVGATVVPGGVGNTEAQVLAAADLGVTAYAGTPDFLKVLMEKAAELGRELKITKAIVGGGPLFPQMRAFYQENGISCVQGYGTADLGSIAYEALGPGGPTPYMAVDEGVILEIVRPGTGDPVPDGEVGEVLVTLLNVDYPLVRFATGDMSAISDAERICGRTGPLIKGWMGRADQTTKVRGMFVRPEQVAEVLSRHLEVSRARLTVGREGDADTMVFAVEAEGADPEAIATTLRDVLKLRAEVTLAAVGSLPNDGKVIDDTRDFG